MPTIEPTITDGPAPSTAPVDPDRTIDQTHRTEVELAGLDALEASGGRARPASRVWSALWPKLAAIAIALGIWQIVVWCHWKKVYVLPPPSTVFTELRNLVTTDTFWHAVGVTMRRAGVGFGLALIIGTAIGIAVSRSSVVRRAIGAFVTGLQTMPSIVWFPLALLLFKATETAIIFVVVLGAAPAIANGLITGIDNIPTILERAGRVLGARGLSLFRHVTMPATLPAYISGLKQGWAFAWRSLMAGELLVLIGKSGALGVRLDTARTNSDTPLLIAYMIVILIIGLVVDAIFSTVERSVRSRRGLIV
jgi:NitT/TauT family transport system permease protein